MSEAKVIFILDGVNLTIQCTIEDKIQDICKRYSTKINKNINSLLFLYEGNKVNFDLCFKDQANFVDKNNHQMKILVSKCDEKDNCDKLNEIKLSNNKNVENVCSDYNNTKSNNKKVLNTINKKYNSENVDYLKDVNLLRNIKSEYFF